MFAVVVTFGGRRGGDADELRDLAETYLADLCHHGQIAGNYFCAWHGGRLTAYVLVAEPGAASRRHHSPDGRRKLQSVVDAFGGAPEWRVADDSAPKRPPTWKGAPFLYLFTHAFHCGPVVCRGDGRPPVPAYRLPLSAERRDALYAWAVEYSDHDRIWIGSGALETAAYRQLADPESRLAQDGRGLCRDIELATGVPTYYYLMRYWMRAPGEDARACPGCGGQWRTSSEVGDPSAPFHRFDFQCDRCRLVSHRGNSTGGGRATRIGEYCGRSAVRKPRPAASRLSPNRR